MIYALFFALLACLLTFIAIASGGWGWLWCWPAFSLAVYACAYAGSAPRLLGKQVDGRLAWWAWPLLAPFLLFLWLIWHLQRLVRREPPFHRITPQLWLGRRAFLRELPVDVVLVVDLTAELPAPLGVASQRNYLALPTLDATPPTEEAIRLVLARIAARTGPIYLHCAVGHGRSATVAVAVLLAEGRAKTVEEAELMLKSIRPGVRLNAAQRRALRRLWPTDVT